MGLIARPSIPLALEYRETGMTVGGAAHRLGGGGRIYGIVCLALCRGVLSALSHTPCCRDFWIMSLTSSPETGLYSFSVPVSSTLRSKKQQVSVMISAN